MIIWYTTERIGYIFVECLLYDSAGKVIGIHGTSLTDIAPGATQGFDADGIYLADYVTLDKVKNYKVIATD